MFIWRRKYQKSCANISEYQKFHINKHRGGADSCKIVKCKQHKSWFAWWIQFRP